VNPDADAAPPPTSSLQRLHRRPAVSTEATFPSSCTVPPLSLPVRVPSSR
jgi:hypothetical protein